MSAGILLAAQPQAGGVSIQLTSSGYRLSPAALIDQRDQLSFTRTPAGPWVEQATSTSTLVPPPGLKTAPIQDAHSPILLPNDHGIAFLRSRLGLSRLYLASSPSPISPSSINILEATPLPDDTFIAAATVGQSTAALYVIAPGLPPVALSLGEARYPALSPDGRWLAYSRFQSGAWNLWLQDRNSLTTHRLAEVGCNQVEPAWEPDSHTLLYASDCGRALGLTAICRRRVLP